MSSRAELSSLAELVAVMDRLRSPGGCPWDARQTHRSLVEYLIEECYEVVEAIESGDQAHLREELGDLLLQVVFHARIAQDEPDPFDINDVAQGIVDKLVTRHPHVFADGPASMTAGDAEARWHELKAAEKGRSSVTEGIPDSLPALLRAAKLLSRSQRLEVRPAGLAAAESALADVPDEAALGDLLLGIVAVSRERGWDAEAAVRESVRQHEARIRAAEEAPGEVVP